MLPAAQVSQWSPELLNQVLSCWLTGLSCFKVPNPSFPYSLMSHPGLALLGHQKHLTPHGNGIQEQSAQADTYLPLGRYANEASLPAPPRPCFDNLLLPKVESLLFSAPRTSPPCTSKESRFLPTCVHTQSAQIPFFDALPVYVAVSPLDYLIHL